MSFKTGGPPDVDVPRCDVDLALAGVRSHTFARTRVFASRACGRAINGRTVRFGDVGLAGEIRVVTLCGQRLAEAARLGFERAIIPARSGLEPLPVDRLTVAIGHL